jgi:hypothetical protein
MRGRDSRTGPEADDRVIELLDVPLEFVGKVARASAVAEARHVERGAVARHGDDGDGRRAGLLC